MIRQQQVTKLKKEVRELKKDLKYAVDLIEKLSHWADEQLNNYQENLKLIEEAEYFVGEYR